MVVKCVCSVPFTSDSKHIKPSLGYFSLLPSPDSASHPVGTLYMPDEWNRRPSSQTSPLEHLNKHLKNE